MYWPQVTEYLSAVERGAFPEGSPLRSLRPVEGGFMGGPIALTGRSAAVFCVEDPSNRRHALRVFLSEPSPNLELIGALSQVGNLPIPRTEWIEDGVESGGEWWPVQLMPWCEGTALDLWVERHRSDAARLRRMTTTLLEKVCAMNEAGVVHGDIQHGNVLVGADDELMFVDLDGLVRFVPATGVVASGWAAPEEAGHPNYQHPERTSGSVWGPSVDLFSALVVDTAVRAIALEPRLMDKFYVEDNLLFVGSDLDDPVTSEVFDRLRELGDDAITVRCQQLTAFCRLSIVGMRPLRTIAFDGTVPTGDPYLRPWYKGLPTHAVVSEWDVADLDRDGDDQGPSVRRSAAPKAATAKTTATIAPNAVTPNPATPKVTTPKVATPAPTRTATAAPATKGRQVLAWMALVLGALVIGGVVVSTR